MRQMTGMDSIMSQIFLLLKSFNQTINVTIQCYKLDCNVEL